MQAFIPRGILLLILFGFTLVSRAQGPQWEWAKPFATGGYEIAKQVAVDQASHHVYVVGDWEDDLSLTFPGGVNPSTQFNDTYGHMDGFVAKYDQNGTLIWAFKVGGENDDQINSIALDQGGDVYITGMMGEGSGIYFSGSSPHTGASTLSNSSDEDFFLAKFNSDGEFIWVRRSETNSGDLLGWDVDLSPDAVYAVGTYNGWATFGSLDMSNTPDGEDIFLVKYSLDGTEQWIAEAGSNGDEIANEVVADASGAYYIGHFDGATLDMRHSDGGSASAEDNVRDGKSDIILAYYNPDGILNWSQTISSSEDNLGQGMTLDADSLYITGAIDDDATFPDYANNPLFTSSNRDIFISSHAKSNGNTGWVHVLPCTDGGDEDGRCIDVDSYGNLFVTGEHKKDLQFPEGVTLTAIHDEDIFVAAFTVNGAFRWAESAGSDSHDEGYGLATGPGGTLYLAGRHDHEMTLGPFILPDDGNNNGYLAKLQDALPPPPNDAPCGALLLNVGDSCSSEIYSNLGANDSGIPNPGCGRYMGSDVWFKAVVPPSGNVFLETKVSPDDSYPPSDGWVYRAEMAVYSGICGSLNQEACYSGNSGYNYRAASAYLFDKIPGDTIWIRIWESFGNNNGQFSICAFDPGYYPAWDFPEELCADKGVINLDTTLKKTTSGFADGVVASSGVPDAYDAVDIPDGATASFFQDGDWIVLDLGDTIPPGEAYQIYFRSNFTIPGPTSITLRVSLDNVDYVEHSFKPETDRDYVIATPIIAEHPTRYIYIGNQGAGGGGFVLDGITYAYRGTRGGTWSGPGVTGSIFDPSGLQGLVSITYSVGGTHTRTDSSLTTLITNSDAGILGNDTTVCAGAQGLRLELLGYNGSVVGWQFSTDGFLSHFTLPITDAFLDLSEATVTMSYRVVVRDGSCAPATSNEVTVTVVEPPLADPGPYGDVCGSRLGLQAILSTGTGVWSLVSGPGMASFAPSENVPIVNIDVDQYGTYTFAWTEINGLCSDDSLITVEFYEPTLASAGIGGDTCSLNFGLNATPSVGLGHWSMLAGPGSVTFLPSDTVPDAIASVSEGGAYTFQWTETNGICTSMANVTVNYATPPPVDPGAGGLLCGLTYVFKAVPSFGTGSWSMQSGPGIALFSPSANASDATVTVTESGTYEFLWTESDGICSNDSAIVVSFVDMPVARAGTGGENCGPDFKLSAEPSYGTGIWTLADGPGTATFSPSAEVPDATVSVNAPGLYQFTWTETNGICLSQESIEVDFLENLRVEAGPDVTVCGLQHGLIVTPQDIPGYWTTSYGPGNVSFSPSETDPMARVTVDAAGEYLFKWEVSQGFCVGEDSVLVLFSKQALANAGPDQELDYKFSTYLEAVLPSADVATVSSTGTWTLLSGSGLIENPNDPSTLVSGLELGENVFQWTLTSAYCPDVSDEVLIRVNDIETFTVITPNNDGLNDVLVFPGIEGLRACEIVIYNRWGTEVYRNEDYQNKWDGRDQKDRPLIQDTYYYILRIPPDRIIQSFVEIRRSL